MPDITKNSWSPKHQLFISLLVATLTIVPLLAGVAIMTGSPSSMLEIPATNHVHFSPRIEMQTSTSGLISTETTVGCNPSGQAVVNQLTTCRATVTDSTLAGIVLQPTGSVTFNQTGIASGADFTGNPCTLAPSTTAGTSTCTVTFSSTTTGIASISGTYGGDSTHIRSASAAVSITVSAFTLSTGSQTLKLFEGTPMSVAITVGSVPGFSGTVELSVTCTSLDVRVALTSTSVTFGPGLPQQSSSTLTGFAPSYAAPGNYTITVIGTDGSLNVQQQLVAVVLPVPQLSAPPVVRASPGSVLTFKVNATDSDRTRTLLLTAEPSTVPPQAYFTSVTGNGTLTGIFDWALSSKTHPGNYTIVFTVSDGRGGVSTAKVVVEIVTVSRTSSLPFMGALSYAAIAGIGAAIIIVGDRLWRPKKPRSAPTDTLVGAAFISQAIL